MDVVSIREQIRQERNKIKRFAATVKMKYDNEDEEIIIGEEWVRNAKGVHSIMCSLNGDECTVINVIFSEGGIIKRHKHDRKEYVFVASGSITETVSGQKINEGQSMILNANQPHAWQSDGAKLTVVWKPPYPNLH